MKRLEIRLEAPAKPLLEKNRGNWREFIGKKFASNQGHIPEDQSTASFDEVLQRTIALYSSLLEEIEKHLVYASVRNCPPEKKEGFVHGGTNSMRAALSSNAGQHDICGVFIETVAQTLLHVDCGIITNERVHETRLKLSDLHANLLKLEKLSQASVSVANTVVTRNAVRGRFAGVLGKASGMAAILTLVAGSLAVRVLRNSDIAAAEIITHTTTLPRPSRPSPAPRPEQSQHHFEYHTWRVTPPAGAHHTSTFERSVKAFFEHTINRNLWNACSTQGFATVDQLVAEIARVDAQSGPYKDRARLKIRTAMATNARIAVHVRDDCAEVVIADGDQVNLEASLSPLPVTLVLTTPSSGGNQQ